MVVRIAAIVLFAFFSGLPAVQAAEPEAETETFEEPVGLGPKGRFTTEQSEEIALRAVPGEVLGRDSYWENDRFYSVHKIQVPDGSIYEVEVNTLIGEVYEIEIEYLAPGARLPMALMPENVARTMATSYVQSNEPGKIKAKAQGIVLSVLNQKPVYEVTVKKSVHQYKVVMDAIDGEILSSEEVE